MSRHPLNRVKEYRRILASMPDEAVGLAVACYLFSSIHDKIACAEAMRRIEAEPGFRGWGRFSSKAPRGPAIAVRGRR